MKKFHYIVLFLYTIIGFAQTDVKVADSLFREDQIYFSVSYNFLQNKPDNFSQYSFSAGLTAGVFRDFPITKNRHWSIAPGLGYSYNDLKQNIEIQTVSPYSPTPETGIVRSRMILHYLEMPLALIVFNLFQIDYSNPFEGNSTVAIIGVVAGVCAILLLLLLRFSKMIVEKTKE